MSEERPKWKKCPKCGGRAVQQVISAPSVARSGMSEVPFDVAVGRDAEARWASIHERQAKRDKVRKESGKRALTQTGRNEYEGTDKKLTPVVVPASTVNQD
jgi:hypothetical protein